MAQFMGAAPRYCGRSEACRLKVPRGGMLQTISGSMRKATTIWRSAELLYEQRILEAFGLQDRYALLYGVFLDGTALKNASVTAHRLIGHGYHTYYIIMVFHETAQYMLGKLGGSHEHYPHLFLFHVGY